MKSRTSCYDPATGRMNLRRYLPVWILYTIGLLLLTTAAVRTHIEPAEYIEQHIQIMAIINMGFALVVAQLLFGDLYTPRLSYALHALPITRGGWFGTQVTLGILGALIPNLINAGLLLFFAGYYPVVVAYWLAAVMLQFLFFYGLAILCAVCAGNRLGMLSLYAMGCAFDLFVYWFACYVFRQLIYGLPPISASWLLAPFMQLPTSTFYTILYVPYDPTSIGKGGGIEAITLHSSAGKLLIYALVGIAAIWLAMVLFRRRKPECAGNVLAFPKMTLPFLVLFTLDAGVVLHAAAFVINYQIGTLMLAVGLVLGYIACQMLLNRQVNVWQFKKFLPLGAILGALLLTMVLTGLDVLGIGSWVPKAEDVTSVTLRTGETITLKDPQSIAKAIELQKGALAEHAEMESRRPLMERIFGDESMEYPLEDGVYGDWLYLDYVMNDGSYVRREYLIHTGSPGTEFLREVFSRPEILLDEFATTGDVTLERVAAATAAIHIYQFREDGSALVNTANVTTGEDCRGLLEALYADMEEHSLSQLTYLTAEHPRVALGRIWLDYYQHPEDKYSLYDAFYFFDNCTHTLAWLAEHPDAMKTEIVW